MEEAGSRDLQRKEPGASEGAEAAAKKAETTKPAKKRVPPGLIDVIQNQPCAHTVQIPDRIMAGFSEEVRAAIAADNAIIEEMRAFDADIVKQFQDKGYAEVQEEAAAAVNEGWKRGEN